MVSNDDDIKVFHLNLPAKQEDLEKLEIGAAVYLNGLVYTAREGIYKKVLDEGIPLPVDLNTLSNVNFHCSPAAAPDGKGGFNVGAVTATASFRFSKWIPRWLEQTGCRILTGKGGMPADDYKKVLAHTDKAVVMEKGRLALQAESAHLLQQPERLSALLGV